jgi:hypothetical protein
MLPLIGLRLDAGPGREGVGLGRIGMVDPLGDAPRPGPLALRLGRRPGGGIERPPTP